MAENGDSARRTDYRNETVSLVGIAGTEAVIEGATFVDCEIQGPAVVLIGGRFQIYGNQIDGDPDEILWILPEDRKYVVGAIEVKDCVFIKCTFTNVGFAGHSTFIEELRHSFIGNVERAAM